MSSRSLAAARARRSGENAPPVSGNRPGTSNGFAQQIPSNNVRVSKSSTSQQQYMLPTQNQNQKPQNMVSENDKSKLPFTRLSVSDAVGLITLRLGRVEQWIIEADHEKELGGGFNTMNIPENSKIVDNSVLTSMIHRIDSLEKISTTVLSNVNANANANANTSTISEEKVNEIVNDIATMKEQITRIGDTTTTHNLNISKQVEKLFRLEREFVETRDILKSFMLKYDGFALDIENKLNDYETAICEIEKNIQVPDNILDNNEDQDEDQEQPKVKDEGNNQEQDEGQVQESEKEQEKLSNVLPSNLKDILKQELAGIN
jgi:hypothetical protein